MKRVEYKYTNNFNYGLPYNGFPEETIYEEFEDNDFTFADFLRDCHNIYNFIENGDIIHIINDEGEFTGEAYWIIGSYIEEPETIADAFCNMDTAIAGFFSSVYK